MPTTSSWPKSSKRGTSWKTCTSGTGSGGQSPPRPSPPQRPRPRRSRAARSRQPWRRWKPPHHHRRRAGNRLGGRRRIGGHARDRPGPAQLVPGDVPTSQGAGAAGTEAVRSGIVVALPNYARNVYGLGHSVAQPEIAPRVIAKEAPLLIEEAMARPAATTVTPNAATLAKKKYSGEVGAASLRTS